MRINWVHRNPRKARPTERSNRSSWVSKRFGIIRRHLAWRPVASATMKTESTSVMTSVPTTEIAVPAMAPDWLVRFDLSSGTTLASAWRKSAARSIVAVLIPRLA